LHIRAKNGTALELRARSAFLTFRYPEQRRRMPNDREVRLKREFAKLYPGLQPGVWYSAAWLSARQFARIRCDGRARSMETVVNEEHFEFRGGRPRRRRESRKR
jgi:hypothetical protein